MEMKRVRDWHFGIVHTFDAERRSFVPTKNDRSAESDPPTDFGERGRVTAVSKSQNDDGLKSLTTETQRHSEIEEQRRDRKIFDSFSLWSYAVGTKNDRMRNFYD